MTLTISTCKTCPLLSPDVAGCQHKAMRHAGGGLSAGVTSLEVSVAQPWTWELMAPLTSSFSLVVIISVSNSCCLFSSVKHRYSISFECIGCPRFG